MPYETTHKKSKPTYKKINTQNGPQSWHDNCNESLSKTIITLKAFYPIKTTHTIYYI